MKTYGFPVDAPLVEPHYKVAKVAELLDVSVDWVYKRIKAGELAVVELGDGRMNQRVPASELKRYLEARTHKGVQA